LIGNRKDLTGYFIEVVSDPKKKEKIGRASLEVFEKNRGVLIKINKSLDKHLSQLLT
jgi:hypothetical protein